MKQQSPDEDEGNRITPIQEAEAPADEDDDDAVYQQPRPIGTGSTTTTVLSGTVTGLSGGDLTERLNSPNTSLIKQYFAFIAAKNYDGACDLLAGTKCNTTNPIGLETFSTEFNKMTNGYEYVAVKDYGTIAPSGKNVVCVKYTYRYKDDTADGLISEVMSFYTQTINGVLMITDRVCEKKYKAGRGLRECPVQAAVEFCEGKIK